MRLRTLSTIALAAVFFACSSASFDEGGGEAAPSPDGLAVDGGAAASDAWQLDEGESHSSEASSSDGGDADGGNGAAADGGVASATTRGGGVTLYQDQPLKPLSTYSFTAEAWFADDTAPVAAWQQRERPCTRQVIGACTFGTCDETIQTLDGGAPRPRFISAGDITISGGKLSVPLTMPVRQIQSDGGTPWFLYDDVHRMSQVFAPGDVIQVKAAGANVAAFDESIAAPPVITVATPSLAAPNEIPRDVDLVVSFSGGTATSEVAVALSTALPGVSTKFVSCIGPTALGSLTVPTALLQKLDRAGDSGIGPGMLAVVAMNRKVIGPDQVKLSVSATVGVTAFTSPN